MSRGDDPGDHPEGGREDDCGDRGRCGKAEEHRAGSFARAISESDGDRAESEAKQPAEEADETGLRDELADDPTPRARRSPA